MPRRGSNNSGRSHSSSSAASAASYVKRQTRKVAKAAAKSIRRAKALTREIERILKASTRKASRYVYHSK